MVDPKDVISPKDQIADVEVLHDDRENWSVAKLTYHDGSTDIGIRWNGDEESRLGFPNVNGQPIWFCVPPTLGPMLRAAIKLLKR